MMKNTHQEQPMEEVGRARSKGAGQREAGSFPASYFHALSLWNLGMCSTTREPH